ncbi:hypothetical protein EG329_007443 [Mollisiaceae sp. DMI_Dod_QoI]|nr:hypothetical protein EG329_007443 [Helotiales sp. DMI_Dod_QoI]
MTSDETYELLPQHVASDGDFSFQTSNKRVETPANENSIAASTTASVEQLQEQQKPQAAATVENPAPEVYANHFSRRKQFQKLLLDGFLRLLLTMAIIGCLYATLMAYETRSVIGPVGKRVFNALVTGLSMTLGISIASSFKAIAIDIRWWILSRKKRPIHEVDAILSCHSLTEVSKLATASMKNKKPGVVLTCILWVLFNIAAQASVSMLGLCYSLNPQIDPTRPVLGLASFSNMTQSYGVGLDLDEENTAASQLSAHTFGEMALQFNLSNVEVENPTVLPVDYLWPCPNYPAYFFATDYFQVVFQESSATDSGTGLFYSNRSITTTSTCVMYPVLDNSNGNSQTFQYKQDRQVREQSWQSIGPNSTTYRTTPDSRNCGDRCASVYVYENNGTSAYYFECNVTVSNVYNTTVQDQNLSDDHARLAAGAIALQGYQSINTTNQYQQFPSESKYGNFTFGNSTRKALHLRQYAIGVLMVADQILPDIDSEELHVLSWLPQPGLILSIDHSAYMWAIFGSIAGSHLVLWIIGAYVASRVAVIENNYLKIALLLRPVTDELEEQGLLLGRHKHQHGALSGDVVYGPRDEVNYSGIKALEISKIANCERDSKKWEGIYDS